MSTRLSKRWQNRSLKTQLRISIVMLVTFLVFMQCLVSLQIGADANFEDAIERAQVNADTVRTLVLQRVNEQVARTDPPPANFEETKALWEQIVEQDPALPDLLEKTMANSNAVVEVMVCNANGKILTSSSPGNVGKLYAPAPSFDEWQSRPFWDRLIGVLTQREDYADLMPLGAAGSAEPVLSIRAVVSSILLRDAVLPQVRNLAAVSVLSLLASIVLAALFSNVVFAFLKRLSQRIDALALGEFPPESEEGAGGGETKEFAAIQSKLDVLSKQFRGAREDVVQMRNSIERMLDRLVEAVLLFGPDGKLISASRSAEQMLFGGEAVDSRPIHELFPPHTPLGQVIAEALETRQPVQDVLVEMTSMRVLANVEPLENFREKGQAGVLVTLRDAETQRQIRSQLDFSTRLAAISRLTGSVAHEIKNPLNAIALHLEILRSKLNHAPEVGPEVDVIGAEISRLDRVVKTFLDFTRPVDLRLHDVNVVEVLRQVAALVWPDAERSGVSVELDAPADRISMQADEDLLKQALLNVVNNGIEAMREGGRLGLRVERAGDEVLVSVSDHGPGIPEAVQDKIFTLYFTTKPSGSGIGLAMTFRIVQLHNGSIDFASTPGSGTTFRLRFPASVSEAPEEAVATGGAVRA